MSIVFLLKAVRRPSILPIAARMRPRNVKRRAGDVGMSDDAAVVAPPASAGGAPSFRHVERASYFMVHLLDG
jgi:hypothetical protein